MRATNVPGWVLVSLVCGFAVLGCQGAGRNTTVAANGGPAIPAAAPDNLPQPLEEEGIVRFIAIGDMGTQDGVQAALAQTIKSVCDQRGCDFALATGDNIYYVGPVLGPNDPQFYTAFELPYADLDFPFYLTLGNHDNGATGHLVLFGDYEVQYSLRDDKPSDKWNMPGRYYRQAFGDVLEIWSIDGDTLTTEGRISDIKLGPDILYDGATQRAWLHDTLRSSPARWKIVFGHYQYGSNGNYGDGDPAFKQVLQDNVCDVAHFYIHGHEHDLRWMAPQADCGRTEFVVTGAGGRAETRPPQNLGFPEYFNYRDSAGFIYFEINGDRITGDFYGDNPDAPVYSRSVTLSELGYVNTP